ncbi:Squamous cell carcinoma antigen recognized by T-cells 3 [Globomyces sp. JEL0801]|nr:Squamous cell carcinoma antigen recognized by T-cells 3 [Globomyces sp. JEL0801]
MKSISILLLITSTYAGFFDFFNQDDEPQQKQHSQPKDEGCQNYICPDESCASDPILCPCPKNQIKCKSANWYLCLQAHQSCSQFQAQMSEEIESDMELEQNEELMDFNIDELKEKIKLNPYDYDSHVQLITGLRSQFDLDASNAAREAMSLAFPLTEKMWKDWIDDTKQIASTPEEKMSVIDLYKRALLDYISIDIYTDYISYLVEEYQECLEDKSNWLNVGLIREICTNALEDCQYHFQKGHIIWDLFIQFEIGLLENKDESSLKISEIQQLFQDRLKVPHQAIDETFNSFSSFESQYDNTHYTGKMKAATPMVAKTRKECDKRESFEIGLNETNHSLQSYLDYISYEKRKSNLKYNRLIRTLYERAILVHYADPYIWRSYLSFINGQLCDPVYLKTTAQRAVRNSYACMMDPVLWTYYILGSESMKSNDDEISDIFGRGFYFVSLNQNPEDISILTTCYMCYKRRLFGKNEWTSGEIESIRNIYKEGINVINSFDVQDTKYTLQETMAEIEAFYICNTTSAYELYDSIDLKSRNAEFYLKYSQLAIKLKDFEKARSIFKESIRRPMKNSESLYRSFQLFEETAGSICTLRIALDLIFVAREKDAKNAALRAEDSKIEDVNANGESEAPFKLKRSREGDENNRLDKRLKVKADNAKIGDISTYKEIECPNAGVMVYFGNLSGSITQTMLQDAFKKYGRIIDLYLQPNPESGVLEGFMEFQKAESIRRLVLDGPVHIGEVEVVPQRCRPSKMKWNFKDIEMKNTVYVSNLPESANKIKLREHFSAESAGQSCALDQTEFEIGRLMGVAISNPSKRTVHESDPKQLFIANLANTLLEPDLENLFSPCGPIDRIRLIRSDAGKLKGIAYIHFQTIEGARKALEMNGQIVDNRVISITIADPNIRKSKSKHSDREVKAKVPTMSMIPRAAVAPKKHQKNILAPVSKSKSQPAKSSNGSATSSISKNQDYFRNLLGGQNK